MVDHFLITRFNLKKDDWAVDKNNKELLGEEWHEKRIKIFKDFCLPSVLSQTTKNFKWLIFFEKSSCDLVDPLLFELKKHSFIEPVYVNRYEEFQQKLPEIILSKGSTNNSIVLTTRLDNDDAINKDFMLELQNIILRERIKQIPNILYYPNGLFLEIASKPKLGRLFYPNNQFLSLLESKRPGLRTIFGEEHHKWQNLSKTKVNEALFWLQLSHEDNQVNHFKGWLVSQRSLKDFHIKKINFNALYFFSILESKLKKKYILFPGRYYLKIQFKKIRSLIKFI